MIMAKAIHLKYYKQGTAQHSHLADEIWTGFFQISLYIK